MSKVDKEVMIESTHVIRSRLAIMNDTREVIQDIDSKEDIKVEGRVAVMAWMLWNNKNNWIWNEGKKDANLLGLWLSFMARLVHGLRATGRRL